MSEKYREFGELLRQKLKDRDEAALYLSIALDEYYTHNNLDAFLLALNNVTKAQEGGMAKAASEIGCARETLYQSLSSKGNPTIKLLAPLLNSCGMKLSIAPIDSSNTVSSL